MRVAHSKGAPQSVQVSAPTGGRLPTEGLGFAASALLVEVGVADADGATGEADGDGATSDGRALADALVVGEDGASDGAADSAADGEADAVGSGPSVGSGLEVAVLDPHAETTRSAATATPMA